MKIVIRVNTLVGDSSPPPCVRHVFIEGESHCLRQTRESDVGRLGVQEVIDSLPTVIDYTVLKKLEVACLLLSL